MQSIRNGEKIARSFSWETLALEPFREVLYYETTILEIDSARNSIGMPIIFQPNPLLIKFLLDFVLFPWIIHVSLCVMTMQLSLKKGGLKAKA